VKPNNVFFPATAAPAEVEETALAAAPFFVVRGASAVTSMRRINRSAHQSFGAEVARDFDVRIATKSRDNDKLGPPKVGLGTICGQ
jgi:hypothetical protein